MPCVDGFLAPAPSGRKGACLAVSEVQTPRFKDYCAPEMYACWGDDLPAGAATDVSRAVALALDETVIFSWTIGPNKATCDAAWAKMTEEPKVAIPFVGKHMSFSKFDAIQISKFTE